MNPSDLNRPCRWALMKLGAWLGGGESTGATGAITVQGHPDCSTPIHCQFCCQHSLTEPAQTR